MKEVKLPEILLPLDHRISTNFFFSEVIKSDTAEAKGWSNRPNVIQLLNCQRTSSIILQPLRNQLQRSVHVSSWFRSLQLNTAIGGSKTSSHMKGLAVDISVAGYSTRRLAQIIVHLGLPFDQMIMERFESKKRPGTWVEWLHIAVAAPGEKPKFETLVASGDRKGPNYERVSVV